MNRRFFLALLLTGAVVIFTPMLFQNPRQRAARPGADSVVVGGNRDTTTPPRIAPTTSTPPAQTRPSIDSTMVRAETTLVVTPKARLRFSSVGAALIGASLPDFRNLGADSSVVELARDGEALIGFRVVAGGDTIALDRAAFHAEAQPNAAELQFNSTVRGFPVSVRWSFAPDTYHVKVDGLEQPVGYVGRVNVRVAGLSPGAYLVVDLPPGFRSSEADSSSDFRFLAYSFKRASSRADLISFGSLDPGELDLRQGPITWAVAKSKYFLVGVLASPTDAPFAELKVVGAPRVGRVVSTGHAQVVTPMRDGVASFEVYAGPQDFKRMSAMGRQFETANPYGGWLQGLVQPFATIVMRLLLWMKDFLHLPYGWTLIAFGVFIRVILWPLNQIAMRSSMRMQRIQPELAAAQKKHANNPEKQRDEIMRIYREHGMSPFSPLAGCFPMLIPMPVLFALFFVFQNTIEFRGVPFWWMSDLSLHDPLYILPIAMGASMFLLSWLGTRNVPPNPQAKMMMYFLPAMMMVFLFKFAAGLNLYYAAQNLAAIPQQWLISNERAKAGPAKT